jgi:hypothetical protein
LRQGAGAVAAGDHHRVERAVRQRLGDETDAGGAAHLAAAGREDGELVAARPVALGDLEGGDGPGCIEQLEAGEDHQGEASKHGSFRGNNGISAREVHG